MFCACCDFHSTTPFSSKYPKSPPHINRPRHRPRHRPSVFRIFYNTRTYVHTLQNHYLHSRIWQPLPPQTIEKLQKKQNNAMAKCVYFISWLTGVCACWFHPCLFTTMCSTVCHQYSRPCSNWYDATPKMLKVIFMALIMVARLSTSRTKRPSPCDRPA